MRVTRKFFTWGALVGAALFGFVPSVSAMDLFIDEARSDVAIDAQRIVVTGRDYYADLNEDAVEEAEARLGFFDINQAVVDVRIRWFDRNDNEINRDTQRARWSVDPETSNEIWTATFLDNEIPRAAVSYEATIVRGDNFGESNPENDTVRRNIRLGNATLENKVDFVIDWNNTDVGNIGQDIVIQSTRPEVTLRQAFRVAFVWAGESADEVLSNAELQLAQPLGDGRYHVSFDTVKPREARGYVITIDVQNDIDESQEENNSVYAVYENEDLLPPDLYLLEEETSINDVFQDIAVGNLGSNDFVGDVRVSFFWADEDGNLQGSIFGEDAFLGNDGVWRVSFAEQIPDNFDVQRYDIHIDPQNHIVESDEENNSYSQIYPEEEGVFQRIWGALFGQEEERIRGEQFDSPNNEEGSLLERLGLVGERRDAVEQAIQDEYADVLEEQEQERRINFVVDRVDTYLGESLQVILRNREDTTSPEYYPAEVLVRGYFLHHNQGVRPEEVVFEEVAELQVIEGEVGWLTPNIDLAQELEAYNQRGAHATGFRIVVDPLGSISETNRDDNEMVSLFRPDFSPEFFTLEASPGDGNEGFFDIDVIVRNHNQVRHPIFRSNISFFDEDGDIIGGRFRMTNGAVREQASGVHYGWISENELLRSNTAQLGFRNIAVPRNARAIQVVIDDAREVPELSENNNILFFGLGPAGIGQIRVAPAQASEEQVEQACEAGVVPGEFLYPFEQVGERVRELLAFRDEAAAELLEERYCERNAELQELLPKKDQQLVKKQLERVEKIQQKRTETIKKLKEAKSDRWMVFADRVVKDTLDHVVVLEKVQKEGTDVEEEKKKTLGFVASIVTLEEETPEQSDEKEDESAAGFDLLVRDTLEKQLEKEGTTMTEEETEMLLKEIESTTDDIKEQEQRFASCGSTAYVCIDTGEFGQQTHLKEGAPDGTLVQCGECTYVEEKEDIQENTEEYSDDSVEKDQETVEQDRVVPSADMYVKDAGFSPQVIEVDAGQKIYVFNVTNDTLAIVGDIETNKFASYSGYTVIAPTAPGSYEVYSSQNTNSVGKIIVREPKTEEKTETVSNPFPQCEKEEYVCIDTGDFGQQTHLKESAPDGTFLNCGECTYKGPDADTTNVSETEPECRVNSDCEDKNQCTTDSCVNGSCVYSEVKACGDTEYSCTDGIDNDRNGAVDCNDVQCETHSSCVVNDPFPQCEKEEYVCIDTGEFGQQTHLKESAPDGKFLNCGDCTYEPVDSVEDTSSATDEKQEVAEEKVVSYTILITGTGFSPADLLVIGGASITFVNNSTQSEKITGDITVGEIKPGASASITIPEKSGAEYGFTLTENTKAVKGVLRVK